ncbi:MMPL family transporter [Williamsia sp.]|uniref:MMPL family transporter n=1 Tax=Williamsia sp. TaxID=1872085 RepID=UPI002F934A98
MRQMTRGPQAVARWSAHNPWRAIGLWLALVVVAVAFSALIPTQETDDADYRVGQSGTADQMIHDAGLAAPDTEFVLITGDQNDAVVAAAELREYLAGSTEVQEVTGPLQSPDGATQLVSIALRAPPGDEEPTIADVDAAVSSVSAAHQNLEFGQTGDVTLDDAINEQVAEDLASAEIISIPITLGIMLFAFGALIAAGIPVLLAVTSVVATIGIYAPISYLVPSEGTASSMVLLIGMAVGVDYSLFYLKREREERRKGHGTLDAVEIAASTSGHSILVSGVAVIASLAGLFVLGNATFNSLATAAIIVVAVAVIGSLTVLPALLVKFGRWVDRPRVPLLWRLNARIGEGGISSRIIGPVVTRPVVALVAGLAVMLALAIPALTMTLRSGGLDTLPQDIPAVAVAQQLDTAFPSEGSSANVVVTGGDPAAVTAALTDVGESAIESGAWTVTQEPLTSASGTTTELRLASTFEQGDTQADNAMLDLRSTVVPDRVDNIDGAQFAVGGQIAEQYDSTKALSDGLPIVVAVILTLTMLMLVATFRSPVIAVVSTLLNLLSVGAAFGVLALVFQHTWAEGLLDFTSNGTVVEWIPMFLLAVLVGLSMDYHVFVLGRIREGINNGLPPKVAVRAGVTQTASVVTSAALVMVSVFALFAAQSMVEMKQMGVGLAVAILLDATIVRLVLLPSILVLLGTRAWWPRRTRTEAPLVPNRQATPAPL